MQAAQPPGDVCVVGREQNQKAPDIFPGQHLSDVRRFFPHQSITKNFTKKKITKQHTHTHTRFERVSSRCHSPLTSKRQLMYECNHSNRDSFVVTVVVVVVSCCCGIIFSFGVLTTHGMVESHGLINYASNSPQVYINRTGSKDLSEQPFKLVIDSISSGSNCEMFVHRDLLHFCYYLRSRRTHAISSTRKLGWLSLFLEKRSIH